MGDWRDDMNQIEKAMAKVAKLLDLIQRERAFHPERPLDPRIAAKIPEWRAHVEKVLDMLRAVDQ